MQPWDVIIMLSNLRLHYKYTFFDFPPDININRICEINFLFNCLKNHYTKKEFQIHTFILHAFNHPFILSKSVIFNHYVWNPFDVIFIMNACQLKFINSYQIIRNSNIFILLSSSRNQKYGLDNKLKNVITCNLNIEQ